MVTFIFNPNTWEVRQADLCDLPELSGETKRWGGDGEAEKRKRGEREEGEGEEEGERCMHF